MSPATTSGAVNAWLAGAPPARAAKNDTSPGGASRRSGKDWMALLGDIRSPESRLGAELHRRLVSCLLDGHLKPGTPLPSTRLLARQLSISRNTVSRCYEQLVEQGLIAAAPRAGFFVSPDVGDPSEAAPRTDPPGHAFLDAVPLNSVAHLHRLIKTSRWRDCRYPFVYGQYDPATFPVRQWREVERDTMSMKAIDGWAADPWDADSALLVDQLVHRVLPRRGVWTHPDCVLVTVGAQNAIFLLAQILLSAGTRCAVEDPGYPDARATFAMRTAEVCAVSVDREGLRVAEMPAGLSVVYCTPARQYPTTVTMSEARRRALYEYARANDTLIIEDDYDSELPFSDSPAPALKSGDPDDRVIYVGSFSKNLAPGLRIGYVVASPRIIRELRLVRRLVLRSPPMNNQHALGLFIERGYYDSHSRMLRSIYRQRCGVLVDALRRDFPDAEFTAPSGGTAIWTRMPPGVDASGLSIEALNHGIYAERGDLLFERKPARGHLRLGFSTITEPRIAPGIRALAEVARAYRG